MISRELEVEILRLHHSEGWPVGTLTRATALRGQAPETSCNAPFANALA
jgi:hypothetical protein